MALSFVSFCYVLPLFIKYAVAATHKNSIANGTEEAEKFEGKDFQNNLATDLAPLLALLGERFTQQFLADSFTIWDHILFSMAPLGVITAFAGAIRVGGANWLKALVGRARENFVQAELELLSSTSDEACELWNGRAIVRTIGRPNVSEIIYAPKDDTDVSPEAFITVDPKTHEKGIHELFCEEEKMREDLRKALKYPPNISLNTYEGSSKTLLMSLSFLAALVQAGALVWCSFLTFDHSFTAKHKTLDSGLLKRTGFALYLSGTLLLVFCMGLCARIIDGSTSELHWTRKVTKPSTAVPSPSSVESGASANSSIPQSTAKTMSSTQNSTEKSATNSSSLGQKTQSVVGPQKTHGLLLEEKADPSAGIQEVPAENRNPAEEGTNRNAESISKQQQATRGSNRDMRMLWVQAKHTAADQNFDSCVLVGKNWRQKIIKSHRTEPSPAVRNFGLFKLSSLNAKTCIVIVFGVAGFIAQFQGLRFVNWTCSIAQLIAIGIASILRAIARRGLSRRPRNFPVFDGHQLDDLALRIVRDGAGFFNKQEFSEFPDASFEFTDGTAFEAIPADVNEDGGSRSTNAQDLQDKPCNVDSGELVQVNAQQVMKLRARLGHITEFKGAKFDEAVVLANAIETAVNALKPDFKQHKSMAVQMAVLCHEFGKKPGEISPQKIQFMLKEEKGGKNESRGQMWKVDTEEIEAALSLATYCFEVTKTEKMKTRAEIATSSCQTAAVTAPTSDWLRPVAQHAAEDFTQVLGSPSHLVREAFWWLEQIPELKVDAKPDHFSSAFQELRLGFRSKESIQSMKITPSKETTRPQEITSSDNDSPYTVTISASKWIPSTAHEARFLAFHMFSAFIWAISSRVTRLQSATCEIRPVVSKNNQQTLDERTQELEEKEWLTINPSIWGVYPRFFYVPRLGLCPILRSPELESIVQEISNTGFSSVEAIHRALVIPLSLDDSLPVESFLDLCTENLWKLESLSAWMVLYSSYNGLIYLINERGKQDHLAWRGAAMLVEFLLRCSEEPLPFDLRRRVRGGTTDRYHQSFLDDLKANLKGDRNTAAHAIMSLSMLYKDATFRQGNRLDQVMSDEILDLAGTPQGDHKRLTQLSSSFDFQGETNALGWTNEIYQSLKPAKFHRFGIPDKLRSKTDINGRTILHYLTQEHPEIISRSLSRMDDNQWEVEVEVESLGPQRQSILHRAALGGNLPVTMILCRNQPKVNKLDYAGRSPLLLAAWHGHEKVVAHLIKSGADPRHSDKFGSTAVDFAASQGHKEVVQKLIAHPDGQYQSQPLEDEGKLLKPLYLAVINGCESVAEVLLHALACLDIDKSLVMKAGNDDDDASNEGVEMIPTMKTLLESYSEMLDRHKASSELGTSTVCKVCEETKRSAYNEEE